jgi:UPF0716 protein FxsA
VPLLALIAIFIVVPLAELYVILKVGDAIGLPLTLAILVADSVLGSVLLKSQGRAVWRRFNETMQSGRVPHREIVDGVLVIFGGAFLITPGFLTDIIGVLLLLPPTRAGIRRGLQRRLERRAVGAASDAARARPRRRDPVGDPYYDVEGTATERQGPPQELPPAVGPRRSRRRDP